VPTSCVEDIMGSLYMHFYVGSEGDALDIPQIDPDRRVRAHGLTMCYRYPLPKHERPRFRDSRNKNARAIVGSYGITVTTAYWSIFDACRDELGFNLPPPVRPVTAVIIPQQRSDTEASLGLASELGASGASLAVDERRIDRGRKAAFSDFIGAPLKILVSGDGFRLRWRDGAEEPGSLEAARAALDRLAAEERVAAC
jgi:hypothetical protein